MFTFIRFFLLLLTDILVFIMTSCPKRCKESTKASDSSYIPSDTTQWIQADAAKATDRTFQQPILL